MRGFGFKKWHRRHEECGLGVELDGSDGDMVSRGGGANWQYCPCCPLKGCRHQSWLHCFNNWFTKGRKKLGAESLQHQWVVHQSIQKSTANEDRDNESLVQIPASFGRRSFSPHPEEQFKARGRETFWAFILCVCVCLCVQIWHHYSQIGDYS